MLTSLLSLYIASSIQPPQFIEEKINREMSPKTVQVASLNFSDVLSRKNIPIKNPSLISPIIDSTASIVVDINSEEVLYAKNINKQLPIASITKLMTSTIILEETPLNEVVKISNNAASTGGSTMYLQAGEELTVKNLLYGVMINSANDAAVALAEHNSGSVENFVNKMNEKAKNLELLNTHFSNPTGLNDYENYSSAADIAKLAKYSYQIDFIREAAQMQTHKVYSVDKNYAHDLETTNKLLGNEFLKIKGLKTGKTDGAGLCLVGIAENDSSDEIITVVLNSPARFTETKILVDWIFRAYNW